MYEENGGNRQRPTSPQQIKRGEMCTEQMTEERKRRSDKREASTMGANKENPNGGINHCSTYPSSL